ncbi:hypothetical protein [Nitrosococcus wardiae]|uniref:NERD domain-containing protein n=1 Tax=Nitrosococcus wardiae TaxID=1814290 RepID=A0A4P7BXA4_9GAMM|nr:hypothetical protein [Nitrosococcus wardiae]QBQ54631.1 hypothetical protein E3U44_08990 [Nitrosococcus wardiae]
MRELVLTDQGVQLVDVYSAEGEVLLGSARAQKEMQDQRKQAANRVQYQQQLFELEKAKRN